MLTGRGAPQEFIDAADLATEMKEIKHPFQDGRKSETNGGVLINQKPKSIARI